MTDEFEAALDIVVSTTQEVINSRRRQAIVEAHPDWTSEQVQAHYELTRPGPQPGIPGID